MDERRVRADFDSQSALVGVSSAREARGEESKDKKAGSLMCAIGAEEVRAALGAEIGGYRHRCGVELECGRIRKV